MPRWKPKVNDIYYFVHALGHVERDHYDGHQYDNMLYNTGNCFRTKEEAEAAAEKVKALFLSLHEAELPKLTIEVFNREDCPSWAKYAAVDSDGMAYYYSDLPNIGIMCWKSAINGRGALELRDEKDNSIIFDSSDWKNSLIERPNIESVPEWCQIGAYLWRAAFSCYVKVHDVTGTNVYLTDRDSNISYSISSNLIKKFYSPARIHYYTAEEMEKLVGECLVGPDRKISLVTGFNPDDSTVCIGEKWYSAQALRICNWSRTDGSPCGAFEHLNEKGEWVK